MNVIDGLKPTATFLEVLVAALRRVGEYNRNDQTAPVAIIWTDADRQWEPLLPRLRAVLPVLTLGPYRPADRMGPAYWLRAVLADALADEVPLPADSPPIIYLPGHSRQALRAVEDCSAELRPLAELQYRGVFWTQKNARDWTLAAFLQSADGGLGIEVGLDNATKQALQRAVRRLADEPIARLQREAPLRAEFFDALLHPDEPRSVLLWLNNPNGFRAGLEPDEWAAFREVCRHRYQFDPEKDGPVTATGRLGKREAYWDTVWKRFAEAPDIYPSLPDLLHQARPAGTLGMFDWTECWPQENEAAEAAARDGLLALADKPPAAARAAVAELDEQHAERRKWVWARLKQAPIAMALHHLARLARQTEKNLTGAATTEIASAYAEWGWQADLSVLYALVAVDQTADAAAVQAAVRTLYRDWLEAGARAFQQRALAGSAASSYPARPLDAPVPGTCLLFSDGLRYDLATSLARQLVQGGASADVTWSLAALPSVTSTAKPAISPIASQVVSGDELTPRSPTGAAVDVSVLRKLLVDAGYQVLRGDETGDPMGRAWTELGNIDSYGHEYGWKVAHQIAAELRGLVGRIQGLLAAGWQRVVVVTDHGFLLLPGGLPKAELPEHLTEIRKGRCARLKPGSTSDQPTVAWRFDPQVRIVVAPGISCYTANQEYEHGGLSPQECVVPVVTVMSTVVAQPVSIQSIAWRGLRCAVAIAGAAGGIEVDLRTKAADAGSSLSGGAKALTADGTVSLLVADDDRLGDAVLVVVLAADGTIRAQGPTVVGG